MAASLPLYPPHCFPTWAALGHLIKMHQSLFVRNVNLHLERTARLSCHQVQHFIVTQLRYMYLNGNCPVLGHLSSKLHPEHHKASPGPLPHFPRSAGCAAPAHRSYAENCQELSSWWETRCNLSRTLCLSPIHPRVSVDRMPISVISVHLARKVVIPTLTRSAWILSKPVRLRDMAAAGYSAGRTAGWGTAVGVGVPPCCYWGTSTVFWHQLIFPLAFPLIYWPSCSPEVLYLPESGSS